MIGTGRALAALAADYVEGAVVDLGAVPRDRLRRLAVEATLRGAVPLIEGVRAAAAVGTPPVVVAVRDADEAAGAGLTLVDLRAR